ncbi:MAG: type II toxin-antitoxin system RelE/ParE family toxin [Planctomycetota bacterium]
MARRLVKDRAAEADLIEIWLYTRQEWGSRQADVYIDQLEGAVQSLAESPKRGRLA